MKVGLVGVVSFIESNDVVAYFAVSSASKRFGYSQQYIRRLLRENMLIGRKIGQIWLIEKGSVENYILSTFHVDEERFGSRNK